MVRIRYDIVPFFILILYLTLPSLCRSQNSSSVNFDISCYYLDINLSDTSSFISGNCKIYLNNINNDLSNINLEFSNNLTIDSIFINGDKTTFLHNNDSLKITNENDRTNPKLEVVVFYYGDGDGIRHYGINTSYIESFDQHVTWSLGEPFFAKYWFPVKQDLNDKADSIIIAITVDNGLIAVSNGLLWSTEYLQENKIKYTWKSHYPTVYYLISITVSDYMVYEKQIPLKNDTLLFVNYIYNSPEFFEKEKVNIDTTVQLIDLFSDLFGVYPFIREKYGHAMAPIGGGMEHQTITTLSGFDFELVAHELAHQWWGDLVTCSSWEDIWINEGFASYAEYLAYEFLHSKEAADEWLQKTKTTAMEENSGSVYVADYPDSAQRILNHRLSYDKGAIIINLLRNKIDNDDAFFTILRTFLAENAYKSAGAEEFKEIVERITNEDYTHFFDSWYYGEGFPEINITWQQNSEGLIINIEKDRNYELEMNFIIQFFNKIDTTISYLATELFNTDTFQIQGMVKHLIINEPNDQMALIKGIYRIPSPFFHETISFTYSYMDNELEIFFYKDYLKNIRLYDIQGIQLINETTENDRYQISMMNLSSGLYIVEIREGNIVIFRKKVINY